MTLVSLIVGLAVAALVAVGLASVSSLVLKQSSQFSRLQEVEITTAQIGRMLESRPICRQTFLTDGSSGQAIQPPAPTGSGLQTLTNIRGPAASGAGPVLIAPGVLENGLSIEGLQWGTAGASDSQARAADRVINARVVVTFRNQRSGSDDVVTRELPVTFRVNENNRLTDCLSTGASGEKMVTALIRLGTCPAGHLAQGVGADGQLQCVPVVRERIVMVTPTPTPSLPSPTPTGTPDVTPTPIVSELAPEALWTWGGVILITTCPYFCDAVEAVSCTGRACPPGPSICYCVYPPGCHAPGSTQTTAPGPAWCW